MFDEIIKTELTDTERKSFRALGENLDFKTAVSAMEKYILRLNANLLVGTETEKGASAEEFYKVRNFIYYWNKFIGLTKIKDETKF